jgi:hypothetical protein
MDGMIFYSPHSKELSISSNYKLDEGHHTPTAFNLQYDGGIFIGLCNHNNASYFEPFPVGTSVSYPTKLHPTSRKTTFVRGTVISAPIAHPQAGIPISDATASPYVIRLIDGLIHQESPDMIEHFVTSSPDNNNKICCPSWLGNNQKDMYLKDGLYIKGFMEWCLDTHSWHFSQRHKNGMELFGLVLPNFCEDFQRYIDDGSIIPGWHSSKTFTIAGSSRHVSANILTTITPPVSVVKALHHQNPERSIWLASYKEEYDRLTFDIISEEEYQRLKYLHGVRAILSMCTFVVKHNNGIPTRAKSRIVVLGNLEQRSWTKADCFSPVISIPMICFLTTLAVHNGRTLKQADCKFAFI